MCSNIYIASDGGCKMKHYYINNEVMNDQNIDLEQESYQELLTFEALCGNEISEELAMKFTRIGEIPYDDERKKMSTIIDVDGLSVMFTKGEVDAVLACAFWMKKGSDVYPLANEDKIEINRQRELFEEQGFAVSALAYKLNEFRISEYSNSFKEDNLVFVGLTADKKKY